MIVRKAVFSRFLRRLSLSNRLPAPERGPLDGQRDVRRDFRDGGIVLEEETPEDQQERIAYLPHEVD